MYAQKASRDVCLHVWKDNISKIYKFPPKPIFWCWLHCKIWGPFRDLDSWAGKCLHVVRCELSCVENPLRCCSNHIIFRHQLEAFRYLILVFAGMSFIQITFASFRGGSWENKYDMCLSLLPCSPSSINSDTQTTRYNDENAHDLCVSEGGGDEN